MIELLIAMIGALVTGALFILYYSLLYKYVFVHHSQMMLVVNLFVSLVCTGLTLALVTFLLVKSQKESDS